MRSNRSIARDYLARSKFLGIFSLFVRRRLPTLSPQASRPSVRPSKDLAQGLGAGEIVWDLTASDKQETLVIAALLM